MSEPFEKSIEKWTDAELIEALRQSLPEMIPYGEMVGAEAPYCHSGPMVWQDPEYYFMAEAANRLERNIPTQVSVYLSPSGYAERYYCPKCHKQQKMSKYGTWYCERCGQALTKYQSIERNRGEKL